MSKREEERGICIELTFNSVHALSIVIAIVFSLYIKY